MDKPSCPWAYESKPLHESGYIEPHFGSGWRVLFKYQKHKVVRGPTRAHETEAQSDLRQARTARTPDEFRCILRQLHRTDGHRRTSLETVGRTTQHGPGWRATAKLGRQIKGPTRALRSEAEDDLTRARAARTREEFGKILERLREAAQKLDDREAKRKRVLLDACQRRRRSIQQEGETRSKPKQITKIPKHDEPTRTKRRSGTEKPITRGEAMMGASKGTRRTQNEKQDQSIKQSRRQMSITGGCSQHSNGWRARVVFDGRTICGPYRSFKMWALADLESARKASTNAEFVRILEGLHIGRPTTTRIEEPARPQKPTPVYPERLKNDRQQMVAEVSRRMDEMYVAANRRMLREDTVMRRPKSAVSIKKEWLELIFTGRKTWEIRSKSTTKREIIGLIEVGSSMIVGEARITESRRMSCDELRNHHDKHLIPQEAITQYAGKKGEVYAWILTEAKRYETPHPYIHPQGAVTWVNLDSHDIFPVAIDDREEFEEEVFAAAGG